MFVKTNRISVRFALRSPKKGESYGTPHPLEVWINVGGNRVHIGAVWQGEKLLVNPQEWRMEKQATSRRSNAVNEQIVELRDHIENIHFEQKGIGKPTAQSVLFELRYNARPHWNGLAWNYPVIQQMQDGRVYVASAKSTLRSSYEAYVRQLTLANATTPITLGRWKRGLYLLDKYAKEAGQPLPDVAGITVGWAKRYHAWLQTQDGGRYCPIPISEGQASRFVLKIAKVLDWLIEEETIESNPIRRVRWPKSADKEVQFLQPEQVKHLLTLNWKGTEGAALWWFCLMCCTGMDYPDAKVYARNRKAYEVKGVNGMKIVGKRLKPPHNEYHLPLLPEVEQLFEKFPDGPASIWPQVVNRNTPLIEHELGINWRITAKTARKTFGSLMLAAGIRIADVSLMMGHASIAVTERHYVKVRGESIDRVMGQVSVSLSQFN